MLLLPLWAEGLKLFRRGHLLSHFQTSYSRYLIESVFLISYPLWAPIQAAGTGWVQGQHSYKHTAVPDSWQTEQTNWDAKVVTMPQEASKHSVPIVQPPFCVPCTNMKSQQGQIVSFTSIQESPKTLILWAPGFFPGTILTSCKKKRKTFCSHKLLENHPAADWLINFRSISNLLPVLQVCTHFIVVRSLTS